MNAARDEARKHYNDVRGCLNDRDGMTFNGARRSLDALVALVERAERERDDWKQTSDNLAGQLVDEKARVVQLQQERDQLAEALKDQGVDPVDYILSRPSWEERREAAKCLFAASVMADGYGKPETAAKFRAAAENLKTGDLAALAASRRAGE